MGALNLVTALEVCAATWCTKPVLVQNGTKAEEMPIQNVVVLFIFMHLQGCKLSLCPFQQEGWSGWTGWDCTGTVCIITRVKIP